MSQTPKLRVAVLYGGRSGEHEISARSARNIIEHLDKTKYDVIPVGIDKQGQWLFNDMSVFENTTDPTALAISNDNSVVAIPHADPTQDRHFDVVFPALHGKWGEDGIVQGLLEMAELPYVGCGVLSSAMCMDKDIAKQLVDALEIPVVDYYMVDKEVLEEPDGLDELIENNFSYPVFIKPANAGSSEGVSKVYEFEELVPALELAFSIDKKVLVEQAINARDIEIAVLQNKKGSEPLVSSMAGEIVNDKTEFYCKEAKFEAEYFPETIVPPKLTEHQLTSIKEYAQDIFTGLECEGLARIDFFIDREDGTIYFNEVNTMPGFNEMSLYPRLWQESGMSYSELLDHLIELAVKKGKR